MSIIWFRACVTMPTKSEKYLVSLKGVYYLAHFDTTGGIFHVETDEGAVQIHSTDYDLYWATLLANASLSILVVDDDPDDMHEIVSAVRHINPSITVDTAHSGTQAINYLSL